MVGQGLIRAERRFDSFPSDHAFHSRWDASVLGKNEEVGSNPTIGSNAGNGWPQCFSADRTATRTLSTSRRFKSAAIKVC